MDSDTAISYIVTMFRNLTARGQFMYECEGMKRIIKLAEAGAPRHGKSAGQEEAVGQYPLEEWAERIGDSKRTVLRL
jgi:hypothetical protein